MPFKDRKKRLEYRKNWYSKNKESEIKHVARRKKEIKSWFRNYKDSLGCTICKENHPATIDFHHQRDDKEMEVAKMVSEGYSIKRILHEIKKCKVLCANCHRKLHWEKQKPLKHTHNIDK